MTAEQVQAISTAFAEEVRAAVTPLVPVCEPWRYDGDALEYCVFHWIELGGYYAASRPAALRFSLTVDWYFPGTPTAQTPDTNPEPKKSRIREALYSLGGSWPSVTDAGDEEGQHWVFETEVLR